MAQQIRHTSTRRSLAFVALPLAAALSATCTSCAAPASAPEEVSAAEVTLPPVSENTDDGSRESPDSPATVSATVTHPAAESGGEGEVAPLSSAGAATNAPSVSVIPSTSPSFDPATTRLFAAVSEQDVSAAESAVAEGADVEARDSYGRSALMRAVVNRDDAMALKLLGLGADPNHTDDFQESAYLRSSAEGMIAVLRSSIEHGADLEATNHMGSTALSVASENGRVESVRVLLQHDIDINHVNDLGWTALHEAVVLGQGSSNYLSVVRLLMLGGADPTIKDRTGKDTLELASERGLSQMEQTIRSSWR